MNCTIENYANRSEWLRARTTGIGSSDAAAVLGESPWKSPFALWAEKRGDLSDDEQNERMLWGQMLEAPVREEYQRRTGRQVEHYGSFAIVRSSKYPWLLASLDGVIVGDRPGVYEGKTTDAMLGAEWKHGPPLKYQIQAQHAMLAAGQSWASLACLIGGNKLVWFDIERNEPFQAALLERLGEFWYRVTNNDPPPVDASPATTRALKLLHPKDSGETVILPDEAERLWTAREQLNDQITSLEKRAAAIDNQFRAWIGDATYGVCNGHEWSLKTTERAGHTVAPCSFRTLRKVGAKRANSAGK